MRIVDTKPARGKMRVSFLAGMRAVRDNRSKTDAALKAANTLSSSWNDLPAAVSRLKERCAELSSDIRDLRRKLILLELEKCTPSVSADGRSIYTCIFNREDIEALRDAAGAFAADHDAYVLCASETDSSSLLVFVRGGNCTQNVGSLLSSAAKANGGKGGGRPEFAQGSAANAEGALRQAEESLRS
jgi:alanyl-tRNA synthetase